MKTILNPCMTTIYIFLTISDTKGTGIPKHNIHKLHNHQFRQTFTTFCCATLIPHSSSTITVHLSKRVDLSISLATRFSFPWILLTNLHRRLIKYSYMLYLNIQHCTFVFSYSMFWLIVPLLARWFLSPGSLRITSIRVIGVNYSSLHNEPGPQTSPYNHGTSWQHICAIKRRS